MTARKARPAIASRPVFPTAGGPIVRPAELTSHGYHFQCRQHRRFFV